MLLFFIIQSYLPTANFDIICSKCLIKVIKKSIIDSLLPLYYMSYQQVRINKTRELQEVLSYLQSRYKALSEAELFKKFLIDAYVEMREREQISRQYRDPSPSELLLIASQTFDISSSSEEPENIAHPENLKPVSFEDNV